MKNVLAICLSSVVLVSCGTIRSMDVTDNKVEIKHYQGKSKCEEISRIFSGVRYDLCLLHSERKHAQLRLQLDPLWLTAIDMPFSAVADTIALPYTIYQQSENGNLQVSK